ncbi:hypothetical protein DRQ50_12675 [bacterium]|nr:MAG: hypothetical protein DRQ50_12675 [bacterium]
MIMTWLKGPIIIAVMVLAAVSARAERWTVAATGAEVVFTSKAPLETFRGRTADLTGWLDFDPKNLVGGVSGELVVDPASFDTGKKKRNRHMRENHLETVKYPTARLLPESVISASSTTLPAVGEVTLRLLGTLDLHGVPRRMEWDIRLSRREDGSVAVTAAFGVLLSDHGIKRPRFLVMKLADEQQVDVRFVMQPEAGP